MIFLLQKISQTFSFLNLLYHKLYITQTCSKLWEADEYSFNFTEYPEQQAFALLSDLAF